MTATTARHALKVTILAALLIALPAIVSASVRWQMTGSVSARAQTQISAAELASLKATRSQPVAMSASSLAQSVQAGDVVVMLTLFPGTVGENDLDIMYFSPDPGFIEPRTIVLTYLDHSGVSFEVLPSERHEGHLFFRSLVLPHSGRWRLDVTLSTGAETSVASFDFRVSRSSAESAR
jgi:hypothetical protein